MRIAFVSLAFLFLVFGARVADAITPQPGDILVVDNGNDVLILVDPATGDRTVLSQGGVTPVGSGNGFSSPVGVTVVPAASPPAIVSVMPSWGLALIFGIAIGALLQTRRIEARLARE